ncbi:MAG: hypothetical protein DWQ01_01070 [Planctomycetota bacterium]|nr:MAG: hypothetical protein DWQ01_01070 [Planctomycetota bacterium]
MLRKRSAVLLVGALLALGLTPNLTAQAHKELGRMWTFENPPLEFFQEEYGFTPDQEWLDHLRLSALRFGGGCSASFVSPRGLIMTNHHCARGNVGQVSPEGEDWLGDGFFSNSLAEEVQLPGLEVRQLVAMKEVTEEVNHGIDAIVDEEERLQTLAANRKALEARAAEEAPDFEHQVVSLYQGGMYQLYSYKVYDDIRLVATPNLQSAKFGGDPDNFTYPRFALDYAFVRAWEDGKPADTRDHYLRWKTEGPTDGETVFVIGNPGSTGRLNTIAQMEYMRDVLYPRQLQGIGMALQRMEERAARDPEYGQKQRSQILNLQNARKAFQGFLDGLNNEEVMNVKREAEAKIRKLIEEDPILKERFGDAWTELEKINAEKTKLAKEGGSRGQLREMERREQDLAKRIGEAFFAVYGTEIPPDATLTTRISDGRVKGFPYNGTIAPWFTSLYGYYARHTEFGGQPPFHIPEIWAKKKGELDLTTPFNLVCTCDIIGGNSGSPLVNAGGEVVGLIFDGNIESLGNRFVFTDDVARAVAVHPAIIVESLRKVYDATLIADEVEGTGPGYE